MKRRAKRIGFAAAAVLLVTVVRKSSGGAVAEQAQSLPETEPERERVSLKNHIAWGLALGLCLSCLFGLPGCTAVSGDSAVSESPMASLQERAPGEQMIAYYNAILQGTNMDSDFFAGRSKQELAALKQRWMDQDLSSFTYFNEDIIGTVDDYTIRAIYYTGRQDGQSQHYCEIAIFQDDCVVVPHDALDRKVLDQVQQLSDAYIYRSSRWQNWSGMTTRAH